MVRVYRKITDFVDKVIGIFDVSWMADGEWLKEVVNEFADFGRFRGAIRHYRASSRHMWIGPGRTSFMDFGEEVEVTRLLVLISCIRSVIYIAEVRLQEKRSETYQAILAPK